MESVVWVSVCWTFFLSLKKYQSTEGKLSDLQQTKKHQMSFTQLLFQHNLSPTAKIHLAISGASKHSGA